ncbi:MAG: DUF421 domain-containing protein [Eubacteriaceae bacterium]|nr:DUF421 domain-containing protein [Eubacteriaceae bacterium]
MIIVLFRTMILYAIVLFAIRIMGSSELSKMSPFQLVVVFMIAELASIPIDSPTASLANGIIAIFTLMFLQILLSFLSTKSGVVRNIIDGKPVLLVDQGKLNVKELRRQRITINNLMEQLRLKDCPSLSDVMYAIMESNGELSVITTTQQQALPVVVINDGKIYKNNLLKAGSDMDKLYAALQIRGIENIEDVFVAFYDGNSQIHVYPNPPDNEDFSKEAI